ncbi:MAG: response regulator [Saprospiraceae bacterium]
MLVNLLLSNAFKYTPEKGKVSVVTTLENGRLKVSVADSGPGISKENLDKIFERFYSLPPTPSKGGGVGTSPLGGGWEGAGTGIGLSLVKELVELHRGQISVESAPGKGTVFKVSLPVGKESFLPEEVLKFDSSQFVSSTVDAYQSNNGQTDWRTAELKTDELQNWQTAELKPTLLIVEDNPDLRHFIAETMQAEYQIITAENGKIGRETAIEHTPDLIVSDVMMPEMDGFELCETLKKDERTSHIPIILLTAKAGQRHKVEGLETGADDYLTKPFDEQELMVRAKNLVEQRRKLQAHFAKMASQGNNGMIPLTPNEVAVTSTDQRFLEKVAAAIEQNLDNEFFSVEDLASEVAFSRSQLHRKLKVLTGKSPNELIREFRLCRAKELLEKGAGNVSEIAMEVGYSSLSYFTRSFKQAFGVSPSEV